MSSVQKISIQGIRSFGPEDDDIQYVNFYSPLTLILGANGCGKTTIIECLKYVTTGDMPPNAGKGGCFVHDPKLVHEIEVKGQVKMQFKDVLGKDVFVSRSLCATQKQKKLETRTLDGTIVRKGKDGQKASLTSKCADLNKEMITSLGVSKPILNSVIFCHQEDSNWPLGEGKTVKTKFDEIFAATGYIKALECIRKLRLDLGVGIKTYQEEMKYLLQNKEQAKKIQKDLEDSETRRLASMDTIKKIAIRMAPLEEKISTVGQKEKEINKVVTEIAQKETQQREMNRTIEQLKNNIKTEFQGSTDELKQKIRDFELDMEKNQESLRKMEFNIKQKQRELDEINADKTKKLKEMGKLQTEAKQHSDMKKKRDKIIQTVNQEFDLIAYKSDQELNQSQVGQFLQSLHDKLKSVVEESRKTKAGYESKENELQNKLDDLRDSKTKVEQSIRMKADQLSKDTRELKQLESELRNIDASAEKQSQVDMELQRADRDLLNAKESMNISEARSEIEKLKKDRNQLDVELRQLDTEMQRMHQQSSTQAELDLLRNEKISKTDDIRKTLQNHEDDLNHILGHIPAENIRYELEDAVRKLNGEVLVISKNLQKAQVEKSTADTERKMITTQLKKKEEDLKGFEEKLRDACGSENFDSGFDTLKKTIDDLHSEKAYLVGSEYIYTKFVEKLQKYACCPLCKRDFDDDDTFAELIHDLRAKLARVPTQVEAKQKMLSTQQQKLDTLIALKPLKSQMGILNEKEIPTLKKNIKNLGEKIQQSQKQIEDYEGGLETKRVDVSMANSIQSDVVRVDQAQLELKKIEKKITSLSSKLFGDSGRTIHQVTKERAQLQDRLDHIKQEVENKQERLSDHRELLQQLEGKVNDLRAEGLEITSQMQRRQQLEDKKADLISSNEEIKRHIQQGKEQLSPLETRLQTVRDEKEGILAAKDGAMDEIKQREDSISNSCKSIQALEDEITKYIRQGQQEALHECEKQLKHFESVSQKYEQETATIFKDMDQIREDLTTSEVRKRELSDNYQVRQKQKEVERIKGEIDELHKNYIGFDVAKLKRERTKLEQELEQHKIDKHQADGRLRELATTINKIKQDLESDLYKNADQEHKKKLIQMRTTDMVVADLKKYYDALDSAIMQFHKAKMEEINKIIRELWQSTYKGNDIDYVEIRTDEEEKTQGHDKRRVYNYRVIMVKGDVTLDMRGRCSAGQKVLASLIIRLALAETFCINCGVFTLDEPTTNLDRENIYSLASALTRIVKSRERQRNFQLVVITHDEDFIDMLGRSEFADHYLRVSKTPQGTSLITKCSIKSLQ